MFKMFKENGERINKKDIKYTDGIWPIYEGMPFDGDFCLKCGNVLEQNSDSNFCSEKCKDEYEYELKTSCLCCGKTIPEGSYFCSKECKEEFVKSEDCITYSDYC
ncbi:hypothetical protein BFS06_14140 [Clostridium perfringens]|uniref:Putative zinc binding protein n=1 Tax=Clostridium perfringens TaxID=1502 RepID=A0A140GRI4_CLOPF|nr:DUF2116 family Zn-ribbon domain-containing protein [Clostridium perfringens]AMN31143.1 putative zinc binding protein [Clostridium perfringens]TBX14347.1 hypothetical protein BFS06_14140 [Clostridium perfringens]